MNARGSTAISLIVLVLIIGSVFFAGGIFPKTPSKSPVEVPLRQGVPDLTSLDPNNKNSLQLKTLKFKECATIAAVNFLVDNSGSMQGSKLSDLKNGMKAFVASFPEAGIIGLQAFNEPGQISSEGYKELISISKYADVKTNLNNAIEGMRASGFTYSKSAMSFSKQKLEEAKAKFPEYKFNFIFISDGIPETSASSRACGGRRCLAQEQNPESVATEIKNQGIRIFTIAYLDEDDARLNDELQALMKNVASSPGDYFLAPVSNQIDGILAQIGQKLCN